MHQSNISSSPSSADIVDDIEKRITTEIEQLQRDIKRIEPVGADWCTFGDLFIDTTVQQYYEALVNTLKSAKRKGVVYFKGQFLLKGMHDHVIVKIVSKGNETSLNTGTKQQITSPDLGTKFKCNDEARQSFQTPKNAHTKSFDGHAHQMKKSPSETIKSMKPSKSNQFERSTYIKYHNGTSPNQRSQLYKSSSFSNNSRRNSNSNLHLIEEHQKSDSTVKLSGNSTKELDKDLCDDNYASNETIEVTKSQPKNRLSVSTRKESSKSHEAKIEVEGNKLDNFLLSPSKESEKTDGDNESVVSFATAPVFSMNKSPNAVNISTAQNRDVAHFSVAGTTFNPGKNSESHSERLEREMEQLVRDIRRIEPQNETFCRFGMLFDDPQVEQYYEALVGTLKAARRKGIIAFKGQILLKGMHDNVQISIVE